MIKLNNITIDFGGEYLFKNISLLIKKSDKIGLIGNNGSGKTTLLRILSNNEILSSGTVEQENHLKVAYLPQNLSFNSEVKLKEYAMDSSTALSSLENKLERLNQNLKDTNIEAEQFRLLEEIDDTHHEIDEIDILKVEISSEKIMKGLGFTDVDFNKSINTFSGGWRMRAELSRLLIQEPDVILLDEPTNHLDLPAIMWLEKFLNSTKCSVVLVSHDIKFLNKNVNRILDISNKTIKDFKGSYTKYIEFREQEIERQLREKKNQDKYIKQANMLIGKFRYKKNKAAFAQTLIRRLQKIDKIEVDDLDISNISFQFPEPLRCGKIIFQASDLSMSYGETRVIQNLNIDIYNGDRIAFVGKNGCGKTTLTKIINGELEFDGIVKKGPKVAVNYFAQNQNDLLDPDINILEYVEGIPSKKTGGQLRSLLGAFLFSGDDVYKKIRVLSGGEKARLSLCGLLLSPSNVIILDEPTNHLDVFAKDILKQALVQYKGTLILVSHDRDFLSGLTDRVIEFTENKIREYPGDIDSYLKDQVLEIETPIKKKGVKVNRYKQKKEFEKKIRGLNKKNESIENRITKIENEINSFKELISNNNMQNSDLDINYDDYNRLNNLLAAQLKTWEKIQYEIKDTNNRNKDSDKDPRKE